MKRALNILNIKCTSAFIALLVSSFGHSNQNVSLVEPSFLAPLVTESLLLDTAEGDYTLIVGTRGHILRAELAESADNIKDFTQIISPTKTTLTSVFTLGEQAWAVGHDATIIRSTDSGKSWELIQTYPELDRPLLDVFFFNPDEGVAVGAYGLFYRSLDGGKTWSQETHPSVLSEDDKDYLDSIKDDEAFYLEELSYISPHFNKLHYDKNMLYLAGEAGLVATSDDKGRNWTRLELDYFGSFFAVNVLPNELPIAAGLRGNMFVQREGGWEKVNTCITTSLNSIKVVDSQVFVFGNNGVILEIDTTQLDSGQLKAPNNEGCRQSRAINQLKTNFSDPITDGLIIKDTLLTVTTSGIKTVVAN